MKVYAKTLNLDKIEVPQELGIEIHYQNKKFTLQENEDGALILRSIDNTQLVLYPKAANTVEIWSEN